MNDLGHHRKEIRRPGFIGVAARHDFEAKLLSRGDALVALLERLGRIQHDEGDRWQAPLVPQDPKTTGPFW